MRRYPIGNGVASPRIPSEFAALMDALQLEGANPDGLLSLNDGEWHKLLELSDLAHLTLSLAQIDLPGIPQWVVHRLEKSVADNSMRFDLISATYAEMASALKRAGVPHLVLKGFTLAPDYVTSPCLRMQSDLDIFCPRGHIETAQAALKRIGYSSTSNQDCRRSDHIPALTRFGTWKWRGNMFDPEMPASVELHFCFWHEEVAHIALPEADAFWKRRVARRLGKLRFPALNPVDQLGYLALHVVRDAISGDWIVNRVHELAAFLHKHAKYTEFWNLWLASHSARLRHLEAVAFCLARNWFSPTLAPVVRAEIDSLPGAHKAWLASFTGSPLEGMFRHNKDGRLLHLLLAESPDVRRAIMHRALAPARYEGPDAPAVRIRNRQVMQNVPRYRYVAYLAFLADRLAANMRANCSFLFHFCMLWLSRRMQAVES